MCNEGPTVAARRYRLEHSVAGSPRSTQLLRQRALAVATCHTASRLTERSRAAGVIDLITQLGSMGKGQEMSSELLQRERKARPITSSTDGWSLDLQIALLSPASAQACTPLILHIGAKQGVERCHDSSARCCRQLNGDRVTRARI